MVSITKHQQKAEQEKFRGPSVNTAHTFVNGEMVIRVLNDSHTLLLPFIIDPFRGLEPLANHFLFGIRPDPAPDPLVFQSATSQQAYNNLTSKLLLQASLATQIHLGPPTLPIYHMATLTIAGSPPIGFAKHLAPTSTSPLPNISFEAFTKTILPLPAAQTIR